MCSRGVPSSWALMKSPAAGMKVSSVPAKIARQRERQRHAQERLQLARVEILRRLEQPRVDLLERDVQRQRHEREEVVRQPGDDGDRRREQPAALLDDPDGAQDVEDEAAVGEDRLPGERPDQVRDEERRDDREQEEVLPAAAAEGDPVDERVADDERDRRRQPGVDAASGSGARGSGRSRPSSCRCSSRRRSRTRTSRSAATDGRGSRAARRRRRRAKRAPARAADTGRALGGGAGSACGQLPISACHLSL